MSDTTIRLRRDVFDAITAEKKATTVDAQMELTGVSRRTLYRIRAGESPNLANAMRISDALGVPFSLLFERVEADR